MSATRPPAFDDRFTTPIEASRRGAHRARPKPASATLPVLAGIAVVLLVIGGVYAVLNGTDSGSGVSAAETGSSPSASAAAPNKTSSSAAKPPASADATSAAATGDTAVDHNVTLAVLNSISVQGLALQVKTKLDGKGWNVARTGNSKNKNLPATKVYYAKTSLKSTAEAMVQDLGYGQIVKDSVVAKGGLVVVLGQDAA
jgi:LytR cell envelope-related transcriptional attenuator